jgi:small-conductance mechanosensitive channel/CRP-like cAMP-binding protein
MAAGFLGAHHWQRRSSLASFVIKLVAFSAFTLLLLGASVVPYRHGALAGGEFTRLWVGSLEAIWWLSAAWVTVGFLRTFVVLGHRARESQLAQDLLAALIYLLSMFAIIAYVFELPVKGLLATSGALAIIIGLALQSSLSDVFSGIVLNLERPYRVGDWIILDDTVQGNVIETNWRATHLLTANLDVAVIPNSIVAKARLVNCSVPSPSHNVRTHVRLEPSLLPSAGCDLLREVLLGARTVLRAPEPTVAIKEVSAEMIDFELCYAVSDIGVVDSAQNEVLDLAFRAAAASGARFAPRLMGSVTSAKPLDEEPSTAERLLAGVSLFSSLAAGEKSTLASRMTRSEYKPGEVVARRGAILKSLCIVGSGVLKASEDDDGREIERARLTPGTYFGEAGLLTGRPLAGEIVALTKVVIYEVSKEALLPLLKSRPGMAEELSEALASRQFARRSVQVDHDTESPAESLADRFAANIKRLFSLH